MPDDQTANTAPRSNRIATVPNAISAARLALAFALPFVAPAWLLPLLVAGALSDWIDGLIAHLTHSHTLVGQLLDPIADKALFLSALLTLALDGKVEWWQAGIALVRDFAVLIVAVTAVARRDWWAFGRMRPSVLGKITTVLVYLWMVAVLLTWAEPARLPAFIAAAACSAASAAVYLHRFVQALAAQRAPQAG